MPVTVGCDRAPAPRERHRRHIPQIVTTRTHSTTDREHPGAQSARRRRRPVTVPTAPASMAGQIFPHGVEDGLHPLDTATPPRPAASSFSERDHVLVLMPPSPRSPYSDIHSSQFVALLPSMPSRPLAIFADDASRPRAFPAGSSSRSTRRRRGRADQRRDGVEVRGGTPGITRRRPTASVPSWRSPDGERIRRRVAGSRTSASRRGAARSSASVAPMSWFWANRVPGSASGGIGPSTVGPDRSRSRSSASAVSRIVARRHRRDVADPHPSPFASGCVVGTGIGRIVAHKVVQGASTFR